MHSTVLVKKDQPFCTSLYRLVLLFLLPPPPTAGSSLEQPCVFPRLGFQFCLPGSVVTCAWPWYQTVGMVKSPSPRASTEAGSASRLPAKCPLPEPVPGVPLPCVRYEVPFPEPSSHLDPRGDSCGWGSWFRDGLDWFGCFK